MSLFARLFGSSAPPLAPTRRPLAQMDRAPLASEPPRATLLPPAAAFTPTKPKTSGRQLTGRQDELRRILQALNEDHAHVVLYSERGRGKTSLSNMAVESLRGAGTIVARFTCDASSDFDTIMRGLMRDLPASLLASSAKATDDEGCEAALPRRPLRPADIVALPERLTCRSLVCLVDEFDRVTDSVTRTQLADAIKQLSDRDLPLLFLLVGVSDNLDEILGQHPSIQRAILGLHLPLFSDRDVAQLLAKGGRESGIDFPPAIVARITMLSRGMPYIAQLIALRLAQATAGRHGAEVSDADFDVAVSRIVADANPRVVASYAALTDRVRDADMVHALRRAATAPQDPWGRIEVSASADGRTSLGGRRIATASWHRLVEAGALTAAGGSTGLYVFADRSLMHHVLLLAAHDVADLAAGEAPDRTPLARPVASNV